MRLSREPLHQKAPQNRLPPRLSIRSLPLYLLPLRQTPHQAQTSDRKRSSHRVPPRRRRGKDRATKTQTRLEFTGALGLSPSPSAAQTCEVALSRTVFDEVVPFRGTRPRLVPPPDRQPLRFLLPPSIPRTFVHPPFPAHPIPFLNAPRLASFLRQRSPPQCRG